MINRIINKIKANKFLRSVLTSIFTKDNIKIDGVEIGDYSYGRPLIQKVTNKYKLKIGKFCSIADNVRILVDLNHRIDWISTYPFGGVIKDIPINPEHSIGKGNMEIGNDVWICTSVTILPGVNIGNGAVIAAGAVVTKNVLPYEIVGGNPAKHIKFRFNEDQIKSLEKIAWWNWDLKKIKKEIPMLQSGNVDGFIRKHLVV